MQDKSNENYIEQKFVNNSWKDMTILLDNKFPVQKNYNKQLLWLLSGLLVFAITAVIYLMMIQYHEIPVAHLTKEKIVYKPIYIEKYIQTTNLENTSTLKSTNNKATASAKVNTNQLSLYPTNSSSSYLAFTNYFRNNSHLSSINEEDNTRIETLDKLIPKPQIIQSGNVGKNEFQNEIADLSKPIIEPFEPKRKIKYNLSFSAFVANNFDYSGYGLGSGFEFPIGKRIGISAGLGVNFISRDYIVLPAFQKNNQDQLLKSNEQANLEKEETYYSGLRSFNQVYVPLGIQYNFKNGLSFNSGVNFRFTYSEQIDNVLNVQANQKLRDTENAKNIFFTNTNIGISAGFGYIINKKLSFNLDSEWGLNSLINNDRLKNPTNTKYDLNLINLRTNYTF